MSRSKSHAGQLPARCKIIPISFEDRLRSIVFNRGPHPFRHAHPIGKIGSDVSPIVNRNAFGGDPPEGVVHGINRAFLSDIRLASISRPGARP